MFRASVADWYLALMTVFDAVSIVAGAGMPISLKKSSTIVNHFW
jgi:hypothetical protein